MANAAKDLYDGLQDKTDQRSLRKRDFLEAILLRITSPNPSYEV